MKIPRPSRFVLPSPESYPDATGSGRGTDAATAYPERDSNPHVLKEHEILSHTTVGAVPMSTKLHRGWFETSSAADRTELDPNTWVESPEEFPDNVQRILSRVRVSKSGCWVWQGAKNRQGYGQVRLWGHKAPAKYAHRVLYESLHGALDRATMVCHSCDNPSCCNPSHLWAGTAKDNAADMVAKKRHPSHKISACIRGHEFTPESHYISKGRRHCLKCARIRANARADRRAGWVPEVAA
jgi:HNH endonuclease